MMTAPGEPTFDIIAQGFLSPAAHSPRGLPSPSYSSRRFLLLNINVILCLSPSSSH